VWFGVLGRDSHPLLDRDGIIKHNYESLHLAAKSVVCASVSVPHVMHRHTVEQY